MNKNFVAIVICLALTACQDSGVNMPKGSLWSRIASLWSSDDVTVVATPAASMAVNDLSASSPVVASATPAVSEPVVQNKVAATVNQPQPSARTIADNIIAQCNLTNGKTVAITLENGVPTYRYGSGSDVEITLPKDSNSDKVHFAYFDFAGGTGSYYRFTNGTYNYVVYSGIGRGWVRNKVVVFNGNKKLNTLQCFSDESMDWDMTADWKWDIGHKTKYDESETVGDDWWLAGE